MREFATSSNTLKAPYSITEGDSRRAGDHDYPLHGRIRSLRRRYRYHRRRIGGRGLGAKSFKPCNPTISKRWRNEAGQTGADYDHDQRQPTYTPPSGEYTSGPLFGSGEIFAGILVVLMVLGPMAAGATHVNPIGWDSTSQHERTTR